MRRRSELGENLTGQIYTAVIDKYQFNWSVVTQDMRIEFGKRILEERCCIKNGYDYR
jgi:hypothetical protein